MLGTRVLLIILLRDLDMLLQFMCHVFSKFLVLKIKKIYGCKCACNVFVKLSKLNNSKISSLS